MSASLEKKEATSHNDPQRTYSFLFLPNKRSVADNCTILNLRKIMNNIVHIGLLALHRLKGFNPLSQ